MVRRTVHLLIAVILASVSAACTSPGTAPTGGTNTSATAQAGVGHIHGVDLNTDDGTVYVATHRGLYRLEAGRPVRVAHHRQDTMGMHVVSASAVFGSDDAGRSWNLLAHMDR